MKGILEYEFPGIIVLKELVNESKAFEVIVTINNEVLWSRLKSYNYPNHDTVIKKLIGLGYQRRPKTVKVPLLD